MTKYMSHCQKYQPFWLPLVQLVLKSRELGSRMVVAAVLGAVTTLGAMDVQSSVYK